MMNEFKNYHPLVNFSYFAAVIGFSMFLLHPACLLASFSGSLSYALALKGRKALRNNLLYMLPMVIMAALINPAFNHEGVTILAYFPNGNPLTSESIAYGIAAAVMLVSVLNWFSCYNEIMTTDKFIYLFGRIMPSLSLVLAMTFRFVPKFSAQLKEVVIAQRTLGLDIASGSVLNRMKNALMILSAMTSWALENAVDTADSMKARGYGLPKRSAFTIFRLTARDKKFLLAIILLSGGTILAKMAGGLYFRYFPSLKGGGISLASVFAWGAYFLLCFLPLIAEIWEVKKWNAIKSKI